MAHVEWWSYKLKTTIVPIQYGLGVGSGVIIVHMCRGMGL